MDQFNEKRFSLRFIVLAVISVISTFKGDLLGDTGCIAKVNRKINIVWRITIQLNTFDVSRDD